MKGAYVLSLEVLKEAEKQPRKAKLPACRIDCRVASSFNEKFEGINGFGSSDCKCASHLFS